MRCFYSVNVMFTAHRWLVHLTRAQLLSFMFVAVIQRENIWRGKSSEASGQRSWLVLNSSWVQGHKKRTAFVESFPNFLLVLFLPDCPSFHFRTEVFPSENCADVQMSRRYCPLWELNHQQKVSDTVFASWTYWLIVGTDVIWWSLILVKWPIKSIKVDGFVSHHPTHCSHQFFV